MMNRRYAMREQDSWEAWWDDFVADTIADIEAYLAKHAEFQRLYPDKEEA